MNYPKFLFFILLISAVYLTGCSDSPSSIGDELLTGDHITILLDSSSTTNQERTSSTTVNLGEGSRLFVGNYNNVSAASLVQFQITLADTIKADLISGAASVTSSWVKLNTNYTLGTASSTYGFTVHKLKMGWGSTTITSDTTIYYDAENLASNYNYTDTLNTFNISTDYTNQLLKSYANSSESNYGIYLRPTSDAKKIVGFQALSSSSSDTIPRLYAIITKPGVYADTVNFIPDQDVAIVKTTYNLPTSEDFYVQGGVFTKSNITYDLTKIPKNSIINYAEIQLTSDASITALGTGASASIYAYNAADSAQIDSVFLGYSILTESDGVYKGDVTKIVQTWISKGTNDGFLLIPYNRFNGVDLFAFKGKNSTQKPKLVITYTKRN